MKFQIRTVCPSSHLEPLFSAIDKVSDFSLVCRTLYPGKMREKIGWSQTTRYKVTLLSDERDDGDGLESDVVLEMLRDVDLLEKRVCAGKVTFYSAERWFKPPLGFLRMLAPSYFRRAKRLVKLFKSGRFMALPIGIHAVRDIARVVGLTNGRLGCLFAPPKVVFEQCACGRVYLLSAIDDQLTESERIIANAVGFLGVVPGRFETAKVSSEYGLDRMRVWSYFVNPSSSDEVPSREDNRNRPINVLWAGRMLKWKRVDVLIKAVKSLLKQKSVSLLLVGEGPERKRLERLAGDFIGKAIRFLDYVPNGRVRELMRDADVYVMPSDGGEGWGAAVSDALTEHCRVVSTYEAGSSATMLKTHNLYSYRDVKKLQNLIVSCSAQDSEVCLEDWAVFSAVEKLMSLVSDMKGA